MRSLASVVATSTSSSSTSSRTRWPKLLKKACAAEVRQRLADLGLEDHDDAEDHEGL